MGTSLQYRCPVLAASPIALSRKYKRGIVTRLLRSPPASLKRTIGPASSLCRWPRSRGEGHAFGEISLSSPRCAADPARQLRTLSSRPLRPQRAGCHGFRYAPAIAFLLAPPACFRSKRRRCSLFCLKLVALLHLCTLVVGHLGRRCARDVALTLVPSIGGYSSEEFRNGNAHFFTVWLVVVSFLLAERGRVVTPAITLALASAVEITPLLSLPSLGGFRRHAPLSVDSLSRFCLFVAPAEIVGSRPDRNTIRIRPVCTREG